MAADRSVDDVVRELADLLNADPTATVAALRQHSKVVVDTIGATVWTEAHDCGFADGRDTHPQNMGCYTNPYEDGLIHAAAAGLVLAEVSTDEHPEAVVVRGHSWPTPTGNLEQVLDEALRQRSIYWYLKRHSFEHRVRTTTAEPGAWVERDSRTGATHYWVEATFDQVSRDNAVTLVYPSGRR